MVMKKKIVKSVSTGKKIITNEVKKRKSFSKKTVKKFWG